MKRKLLIAIPYLILIITAIIFLISSCSGGSYRITIGHINSDSNSIEGSYNSFSGSYYRKIKLTEGDEIIINFKKQTKKGSLDAELISPEGNKIEIANESKNQSIIIKKSGTYKITVIGDGHEGNFIITWYVK